MSLLQKLIIVTLLFVAAALFYSTHYRSSNSLQDITDRCFHACLKFDQQAIDNGDMKSCYRNDCSAMCSQMCQKDPNPERFEIYLQ